MKNLKKLFFKIHFKAVFNFGVLFTITFVYVILSLLLLLIIFNEQKEKQLSTNSFSKILYIFYNPKDYSYKNEDEIIFDLRAYHFTNWGDLISNSFWKKRKNWKDLTIIHGNKQHVLEKHKLGEYQTDRWPFRYSSSFLIGKFWKNYRLNHKNNQDWVVNNNNYLELKKTKTQEAKFGLNSLSIPTLYAYVTSY